MGYYRKKPVVIEAIQLVSGCYEDMVRHMGEEPGENYVYLLGSESLYKETKGLLISSKFNGFEMWIKTLEGVMTATVGDYIIKGVNGEFYPCKPDIFEKTYEEVNG